MVQTFNNFFFTPVQINKFFNYVHLLLLCVNYDIKKESIRSMDTYNFTSKIYVNRNKLSLFYTITHHSTLKQEFIQNVCYYHYFYNIIMYLVTNLSDSHNVNDLSVTLNKNGIL